MINMELKYNLIIDKQIINARIKKLINQTYKLLPMREEGRDWEKPLQTIIEQLAGMKRLFINQDDLFFLILCKMEGLFSLNKREDISTYRRIIFEILGLLNNLNKDVNDI